MDTTTLLIIIFIAAVFLIIAAVLIIKKMKGSIEIIPEKYQYSPGETIKGKVILKLKKPVNSFGLKVGLVGRRTSTSFVNGKSQRRTVNVFDFRQPIAKAENYSASEHSYDFSLKIPKQISARPEVGGIVGDVMKAAEFFGAGSMVKWYLTSNLDCEGLDISRELQINIA